MRMIVFAAWIVFGFAIPMVTGWLLLLARVPVLEASPFLFGLGMAYASGGRSLTRALYRAFR